MGMESEALRGGVDGEKWKDDVRTADVGDSQIELRSRKEGARASEEGAACTEGGDASGSSSIAEGEKSSVRTRYYSTEGM